MLNKIILLISCIFFLVTCSFISDSPDSILGAPAPAAGLADVAPVLFDSNSYQTKGRKKLPLKVVPGRQRETYVNNHLLWSQNLTLNLFDDVSVIVSRQRVIDKRGTVTWIGYVEDALDSEVFLTEKNERMTGIRLARLTLAKTQN